MDQLHKELVKQHDDLLRFKATLPKDEPQINNAVHRRVNPHLEMLAFARERCVLLQCQTRPPHQASHLMLPLPCPCRHGATAAIPHRIAIHTAVAACVHSFP